MSQEEKIRQLQHAEQGMQQLLMQKQSFQAQLLEVESAQEEIRNTETVYKVVGNLMLKAKKGDVEKELSEKSEILSLRLKNIEKQEKSAQESVKKLREEILQGINEKEKK
jgi:prefoldin beta subunit